MQQDTQHASPYLKWVIFALVFLSTFLWLGKKGIFAWDEARYGENAYWMLQTGDYVHYSFAGAPDQWNAKPPLANWLISLNYRWLGCNTWALRLHSALAVLIFFVLYYRWIRRYQGEIFALASVAVLLCVKGIIGHHVGRTGDTDGLLLACLMGYLYALSSWLDFGERKALLWGALSLGLAFYSKGTTLIFYLPGTFLYLLIRRKLRKILREPYFWLAAALLLSIIASWILLVEINTPAGEYRSWHTLLFYDTVARFTQTGVEGAATSWNVGFVFEALDIKFNLWNYLLYLSLLLGGLSVLRSSEPKSQWWQSPNNRLYILSLCMAVPLAILLTVSKSKLVWYIAPILPFAAIGVADLFFRSLRWQKQLIWLWGMLALFTFGRQAWQRYQVPDSNSQFVQEHREALKGSQRIYLYREGDQEMRLYADWYAEEVVKLEQVDAWPGDGILLGTVNPTEREALKQKISFTADCKADFCIVKSR
ncbi:MAG: glycosyltransferase family 39 protein [Bacteroidota bacterium]